MTEKLRDVNVDGFEIGGSSFLHVPCVVNLSALINTKKEKLVKQTRFFLLLYTSLIIGTLRSEDSGEIVALIKSEFAFF